ncbi:toxin-antitoxin system YwqK family antitoxin [Rufibacter latericius]|uniref:Toxin-antitoxin system YwqK family antitoxin n=1 Tax=Rufibacter latericius TaxID=2487040 RepID=A0A3M9MPV1_9BACT|nr:hypothetical protein [Rufibacter latericius]RNI26903.1 hypothetical protein EFB08_10530 [Rufibacter latericius]
MKIPLLLICLLAITTKVLPQNTKAKQVLVVTTDTVYFDQDWERTDLREDSKYARIIKRTPDGKPSGTVRDFYYPSWKKQWEGKLLSESPDIPNGLCTYWYPNGKIQSIVTYKNGKPQEDLREWHKDGTKVVCKYQFVDALPLTKAKLHSYYNTGSSRTVQAIELPANSQGIVFKIDIRDEGEPPIDWSTAARLATLSMTGGTSEILLAGARALDKTSSSSTKSPVNTKCHYYITTSLEDARYFEQTKGSMPVKNSCFFKETNVPQNTRNLAIPKGATALYICVMNDNLQTSAEATLSVSVLQKQCN